MATQTKEYLIKTVYDSTGIKQFTSDVEKAKVVGQQLGLSLTNSAKVIDQQVTTSINKAGQTVRTVTTIFEQHGKKSKVAFSEVNGVVQDSSQKLKNFGSAAAKSEIDLGKLIQRAAVTIPVWLALRAAITGVFHGITGGIQNLVSFDNALQKVRRNLMGTPEEIQANFDIMKKEITDFSLRTGIAVEEIAESIKNFATIGFNFKDSMTGGFEATRLASLLFGDASDTANAFASALKVLVKEGKDQIPVQQQISEAMALTAELARDNKDDIGELTQGLSKFAATAKTSNLSMKETITLLLTLATAGRSGAMSGTLLSTTFNKLLTNLDDVSKRFGIEFNPAVDSGITALMKLLDAASEMAKTPTGQLQVIEKLADVLGGERGTKMVTSLLAVNDILKKNMSTIADVNKFHSDFDKLLETDFKQAQILSNSLKELGKSFVTNLVGANNFNEALKQINTTVNILKPGMDKLAITLGNFGRLITLQWNKLDLTDIDTNNWESQIQNFHQRFSQALQGKLSQTEIDELKIEFNKIQFSDSKFSKQIQDGYKRGLELAKPKEAIELETESTVNIKPVIDDSPIVIASTENQLNEIKARLKAKGATDIQLALLDIDFEQAKSIRDIDKIRDAQSKLRVDTISKERAIQDELLRAVEEGAKAQGASNLEALNRRIELEKQLGIERTGMELLKQQLDLQKALTEQAKKTREERLKELQELVKQKGSPFGFKRPEEQRLDQREARLRSQASFRGISDEEINRILNPEALIKPEFSLINDLQTVLADPMTTSMGSLENAISSLTQTILQQEIRPLGVTVPGPSKSLNFTGANGGNAVALSPLKPEASITNIYDMGGIKVTVTGETNAEVLEKMARMFKDMVAAELIKKGTPINLASRQVIREE